MTCEIAQLAIDFEECIDDVTDVQTNDEILEPRLKFKRISNGLDDITSTDSITCLAVHEKFIAIGTEWGRVHLLDHIGYPAENGIHSVHSTVVNDVSISERGDYVASCADDGRLAVYSLTEPEANHTIRLDHAIKCIALAPDYIRTNNIVVGFRRIYILSHGVFNKTKRTELTTITGIVHKIRWNGDIILWADDVCVCVYDARFRYAITYLRFSAQHMDYYGFSPRCEFNWCSDNSFLICRGNSVRICHILERDICSPTSGESSFNRSNLHSLTTGSLYSSQQSLASTESQSRFPMRFVEVTHRFELDNTCIFGISKHQTFLLLVCCKLEPNELKTLPKEFQPQLLIVDVELNQFNNDTLNNSGKQFDVVYCKQLEFDQKQLMNMKTLRLGLSTITCENTHYIFSAKEMHCAQELTTDDRIDWLLEKSEFSRGLQLAKEQTRQLARHSIQSVGVAYVDHLLSERQYDAAAKLCFEVLASKVVWEEYVHKFCNIGQIQSLTPYLPNGVEEKSIKLDPSIFKMVLIDYMNQDPVEFLLLLTKWCKQGVVDINENFIQILSDRIKQCSLLSASTDISQLDQTMQSLYRALGVMYEEIGSYDLAINLFIRLRDPGVFEVIERNVDRTRATLLIDVIKQYLLYFMELDTLKTVNLLIDYIDKIPVDYVMSQLNPESEYLFHYLDTVFGRYPQMMAPNIIPLISLYIKYCREKILPLLRSADNYPLSKALKLCEDANFVTETVYLLTRIGRRHDALQLIMTKGGDHLVGPSITGEQRQAVAAAAAIAYCREEDSVRNNNGQNVLDYSYGELWQQVVLFAVDKPAFVRALLQQAGSEGLDPRLLLRKIAPDMIIPGLKDALIKLMHDYKLQLELHRSCQRILCNDVHSLYQRLMTTQTRAIHVKELGISAFVCIACARPLSCSVTNQSSKLETQIINEACGRLAVFRCKHICHVECLAHTTDKHFAYENADCPLCAKLLRNVT